VLSVESLRDVADQTVIATPTISNFSLFIIYGTVLNFQTKFSVHYDYDKI